MLILCGSRPILGSSTNPWRSARLPCTRKGFTHVVCRFNRPRRTRLVRHGRDFLHGNWRGRLQEAQPPFPRRKQRSGSLLSTSLKQCTNQGSRDSVSCEPFGTRVSTCIVGAISKIRKPASGKRKKNDRDDVELLARQLAVRSIAEVFAPGKETETARSLSRVLKDVRQDSRARSTASPICS